MSEVKRSSVEQIPEAPDCSVLAAAIAERTISMEPGGSYACPAARLVLKLARESEAKRLVDAGLVSERPAQATGR